MNSERAKDNIKEKKSFYIVCVSAEKEGAGGRVHLKAILMCPVDLHTIQIDAVQRIHALKEPYVPKSKTWFDFSFQ